MTRKGKYTNLVDVGILSIGHSGHLNPAPQNARMLFFLKHILLFVSIPFYSSCLAFIILNTHEEQVFMSHTD